MAHPRLTDKDISTIADTSDVCFLYDAVFTLRQGVYYGPQNIKEPMVFLFAERAGGSSKLHTWEPGVTLRTMLLRQKNEDFLAQYLDSNPSSRIAKAAISDRTEDLSSGGVIIAGGKLYCEK